MKQAAERYAEEIGAQSTDPILREGLLRAAVCMLTKALEREFEGYEDILGSALRAQAELIDGAYSR